ncbi:MAG: flagellin [Clostridia bacterium]|nr:flagellin [Clostridia bacterium]
MVIAHNISALNTYKSLGIAGGSMQKSMEKLSSGYKINKAGDDAAGLSISEKMRSQIRGLNQASTNAENGVSMIQTAEGALNEQHSILQRMRELAVQAATDTNADEDREALQSEMAQLTNEVNRIAATTEFNGMKILNGEKANKITIASGNESSKWTIAAAGKATSAIVQSALEELGSDFTYTDDGEGAFSIYSRNKFASAADITAENDKVIDALVKAGVTGTFASVADGNDTLTNVTLASAAVGTLTDQSVYFHVGANSNQVINTEFNDMSALRLGIAINDGAGNVRANFASEANVNNGVGTDNTEKSLDITTRAGANYAISVIDSAIKKVSEERSKYGAIQNRLEYTMNNLNTTAENMTAAESTIRDVDMAEEMMEYTKNNILQQAAQAMLVQANARPQQALQLLQ